MRLYWLRWDIFLLHATAGEPTSTIRTLRSWVHVGGLGWSTFMGVGLPVLPTWVSWRQRLCCLQGCHHGVATGEGAHSRGQECTHQGGACSVARAAVPAGELIATLCLQYPKASMTATPRAGVKSVVPSMQADTDLYEILHLFESGRCHM